MPRCNPTLLRLVRDLTGNVPGEGGLITFPDSAWLASIVIPHQPHFIDQLEDVFVLWGYGLAVDRPSNFIRKPMSTCSGREMMTEVLGHLRIMSKAEETLDRCIPIPCLMPFITGQFMPCEAGDRPAVLPAGTHNLAFVGRFCELRDDVVFTVEYLVRPAQLAPYGLLGLQLKPHAVYKGKFHPRVLLKAFRALHDIPAQV